MLEKTEYAVLTGFLPVLDTAPSFTVPLFRECDHGQIHRTFALLAQLVDSDHIISGYQAFDPAWKTPIPSSRSMKLRVGAPSLVGYWLGGDEIVAGTFEELRARLGGYVQSPIFDNKPFSHWELCEFCDRTDVFPEIARTVKSIASDSRTSEYFLANCLARSWIEKRLGKEAQHSRATKDHRYKLFVLGGDIAFSVSDAAGPFRQRIALYVNLFNKLMAARTDLEREAIHDAYKSAGHKSGLGTNIRAEIPIPPGIYFERLIPQDLCKGAVVPQALDNQWVPRTLLEKMVKTGTGWADVNPYRQSYLLDEWRRALVYGEQLIVNRSCMVNNSVLSDDYDNSTERECFKQLLREKAIVPFLVHEDSPDQIPDFDIDEKRWDAWMDIVHDTHLSCVRLGWGDQTYDYKRLSNTFHNYVQTLNTKAQHLANHFEIQKEDMKAFRVHLRHIASYAHAMADTGPITRSDLYRKFVCVEGSNVADGEYDRSKPFVGQTKQIIDLKYNVILSDVLGRYALTPADSPPRSVLGDLEDVVRSQHITDGNVAEVLLALRQLGFDRIAQGRYLKSLGSLDVKDVIQVRDTDEWEAYRRSVNRLLDNPFDFSQLSARFYTDFGALNKIITRVRMNKSTATWEPWVKFMISVGARALVLWFNPADAAVKLLTTLGTGSVTTGATPFLMRMTVTTLTETEAGLDVSLDFMRGTVGNGREVWNEITGQLCSTPGFQVLEKAISEVESPNQSPAEDMGHPALLAA